MSKKMKGVVFDHQTLVQDFHLLQKETQAARNQLEVMKLKKQTLEAEVRFLRRRRKFLLKTKSQDMEATRFRKNEKVNPKKVAAFPNLPLVPNLNQRGKMHTKKKNIIPSQPPLGRNVNSHGVNPNQRVLGNNSSPMTEYSQKDNGFSGEKVSVRARAPIFDLNQISMEEEEMQESFEGQMKEHQNDLMLSVCRNVGDGSTNRSGKRKISWQDPVALRV